jgi:hypothetical protein
MTSLQTSLLSRPTLVTVGALVCLLSLVVNPTAGRALIQQNGTYVPNAVNRMPDANDQDKMQQQQNDHDRIEAANAQRKREVAADSEKLLKMVTELKQELDKTDKDTLPVGSIHKIEATTSWPAT